MAIYQVHRSDANAVEIISALRQAGASVESIGRPLDILVGWRGETYLVEIKTPQGKLRQSQKAFLAAWKGHAMVVRSVDEAMALLGIDLKRKRPRKHRSMVIPW